jgi:hypothetical protein
MWQVHPLLGNDRERTAKQQPLLSNGFGNKHVSTATIAQQQWNGIFCALRAEVL